MKLRIQDNSVRFRITLSELEVLERDGRLAAATQVPGASTGFTYGIERDDGTQESALELRPYGVILRLCPADLRTLAADDQEGVYVRREWQDDTGHAQRFIAFVEKDRPSSVCDKPEAWIYEEVPGQRREVRPMPGKAAK
jgi:hypothetical protein